jgi:hypothetical protein
VSIPQVMLVMTLLNHAGDGTTEVTLAVAQCRCRVVGIFCTGKNRVVKIACSSSEIDL